MDFAGNAAHPAAMTALLADTEIRRRRICA